MAWRDFIYWLTIKPRLKRLREILPEAKIYPCGSRYVCNPPKLTTDIDFLVYCEIDLGLRLQAYGYKKSIFTNYSGSYDADNFDAYRKGKVNLIVTSKRDYANDFNLGTALCKQYNVRDKYYRVMTYEHLRTKGFAPEKWSNFDQDLAQLLRNMTGPYEFAAKEIYRIQHNVPKV